MKRPPRFDTHVLSALAERGDPAKCEDRRALVYLVESVARTEAAMADFIARANVQLAQLQPERMLTLYEQMKRDGKLS